MFFNVFMLIYLKNNMNLKKQIRKILKEEYILPPNVRRRLTNMGYYFSISSRKIN